jgi:hypothetical protein
MKRTISLFLLVFVLIGIAQAQETKYVSGGLARQMALGGSPTNAYLMDYTDIYTNPAWAVKYSDIIYSELGYSFAGYSASGQSAGFTYAIWKGFSVGLSIGKQEGPVFVANSYGSQFGGSVINSDNMIGGLNNIISGVGIPGVPSLPASISNTWRPLQVYGAFKLGGMTLGAAIYRVGFSASIDTHSGSDTVNEQAEASFYQTGLKAGMLLDMDVMLLDVSALLRINSATGKITPPPVPAGALSPNQEVDATGTEIALNARLFIKLSDKFTFVPMARFSTFGYEPEIKAAVTAGDKLNSKPNKYGRTEIEFGAGANINVPGGRVFAGLSLESISLTDDTTSFVGGGLERPVATPMRTTKFSTSVLSLPKINLGAEFEIASWLTGRLGYFKAFATQTITTEAPAPAKKVEFKYTYEFKYMPTCSLAVANQLLSLGVGLHFDRLSIDGYLCEEWLADGIYIASGKVNAMFAVLSMSYSFN